MWQTRCHPGKIHISVSDHLLSILSSSPLLAAIMLRSTSPTSHSKLRMPDVANLFVKLRRANKTAKAHHIESSSGDEPLTHDMVGRGLNPKQGSLRVTDTYVVAGGVNAKCLLRATRNSLLEVAEFVHAESEEAGLYDEQYVDSRLFTCVIDTVIGGA